MEMGTKIFVNLPIESLGKSVEFFTKLGFKFDPQFTDETAPA
jgi:predicted lactoylglutathione lyase